MERTRQEAKWGDQSGNTAMIWATVLGEEFGEVCEAALRCTFGNPSDVDREDLREELIQVAAVATAWVEYLDR